jgi:FkbM family methyltransferase
MHFKGFLKSSNTISKEYISQFIPNDAIIVEAGAHIGMDTIEMAKFWPNSTIYAFEPVPEIFEQLKKNTSKYKNVKCFKLGLSDKCGKAKIFVSSGDSDGSSSLLKPKEHLKLHPKVKFDESIDIPIVTLEKWAKDNKIKKIDFLWLDLQGMEYKVLSKSGNLLTSVKAIVSEISLVENYSKGVLYKPLKNWLAKKGFMVQKEEILWSDGGNVLFVKK